MSRCGRCRGRGYIKPTIGFGDQSCPDCKGNGVKQPKPMKARSGSVPLSPGARCIVCGQPAVHNHHPVKRQRIDWLVTPKADAEKCKADPRGVTPLCDACHVPAESEKLHLQREHLHPEFAAFVADWDLWPGLPRYMTCGTAAETPPISGQGTGVSRTPRPSREVSR